MPQINYGVRTTSRTQGTRCGLVSSTLNLAEAAALLKCSTKWLRGQVEAGTVPGRRIGRKYLFSRAALNTWLAGESPQT